METDGGHVYAATKTQRSENIGDSNELLAKKLTLKLLKLVEPVITRIRSNSYRI